MRIAIIGTLAGHGPGRDGVDKALSEICPRLAERGYRIDVFCERRQLLACASIEGARLIRVPHLPLGLGRASPHALLSSLLAAVRGYDVVNFFAAHPPGLYSMAAHLGGARTVTSIHGLERADSLAPGPVATAARLADAVIVSSRRLERLFRDSFGRDAVYIPNGVDPPGRPADSSLLEPLGLEPDSYVLFADRLEAETGAHVAVAAANALPPHRKLVIAQVGEGDDEYARQLRSTADPERVVFAGKVEAALLDALMGHAYLYLLPSQADEAPETLLASLTHGRAVLASDVPEHLDVMAGDGFTFTAGDVGDLRRVLSWLSADPEVVGRMRLRASESAAGRFGWDRIADAYEQVYRAIV
ncbi:MAG TPA: glycosyltransferase family 4 protein [Magnetospirillum sp.]|jgi:glycosyltransferase involved in cell wall biosynthesis|nr:glycosyltransferase family 4 protein [Magnetospirillum sp.]